MITRVQIEARRALRLLTPDFRRQPREAAVVAIIRQEVRMQIVGMEDGERLDLCRQRRTGREAGKAAAGE